MRYALILLLISCGSDDKCYQDSWPNGIAIIKSNSSSIEIYCDSGDDDCIKLAIEYCEMELK